MKRILFRIIIVGALAFSWSSSAFADWKSDIGYNTLQNELGSSLPTGSGVNVTQVEANSGKPDPTNSEFSGKIFTAKSPSLSISGHGTTVGQYFYGNNTSIAPGVTNINCYDTGDWLVNFIRSNTSAPLFSIVRPFFSG